MRKLAILITAALPAVAAAPVQAEQVLVRIEAKRGPQTQAVVDGWAQRLPGVVTFPLPGGWTGIGIGPLERAQAQAELTRLKAAGTIPADSFIAPAPATVVPVQGGASDSPVTPAQTDAAPTSSPAGRAAAASTFVPPDGAAPVAPDAAPQADAVAEGTAEPPAATEDADAVRPAPTDAGSGDDAQAGAGEPATTSEQADAAAAAPADGASAAPAAADAAAGPGAALAQGAAVPAAGDYLRLQRFETRVAADEALAGWRAEFPEAGLFQQPDGGYAVALGPLPAPVAEAWLGAFRAAERVGKPGAVMPAADLGTPIEAAAPIDLPGPGDAAMPPLDEVQRALRWAGRFDGRIDGKDGPQTRAAIAAEALSLRAAPDAPTAMTALIARRAAWQGQMGLTRLDDPQSGLSVTAPMDRLQFDRNDQGLSIYGPRDGSGAALILYSAPGGQQEMLDFTGLVTALGWVPSPERHIDPGHASLKGRNDTHIGQAEARVVDGRVQGVVLIWPVMDAGDQPHVAAEVLDSLRATPAPEPAPQAEGPAETAADPA